MPFSQPSSHIDGKKKSIGLGHRSLGKFLLPSSRSSSSSSLDDLLHNENNHASSPSGGIANGITSTASSRTPSISSPEADSHSLKSSRSVERISLFGHKHRNKSKSKLFSTDSASPTRERKSFFGTSKKDKDHTGRPELERSKPSMTELKRFFKPTRRLNNQISSSVFDSDENLLTTPAHSRTNEEPFSPTGSRFLGAAMTPGEALTSRKSQAALHKLMDQNSSLESRYGKLGKVLGSGAGGSVFIIKRPEDNKMFAVKEFRARHKNESEKNYTKKVNAEFCIGSTLHHVNVIQTVDIIHHEEHGQHRYFEVMEYGPYDFFTIVMSGLMSRPEISCYFKQILGGVSYLHSVGLAHRDLKLDNCVVTDQGILKLIDFGSATVFKYPSSTNTLLSHGVVGSDPYLAPEVLNGGTYDPQKTDIWSVAIMFCCMSLNRFPWKIPKLSDNSFKLFCQTDNSESKDDKVSEIKSSKSKESKEPKIQVEGKEVQDKNTQQQGATTDGSVMTPNVSTQTLVNDPPTTTTATATTTQKSTAPKPSNSSTSSGHGSSHKTITGPNRLLRLLPSGSRNIIGLMLELDPRKRASLTDIWGDAFIQGIDMCTVEANGDFHHASDHEHHLVNEADVERLNKERKERKIQEREKEREKKEREKIKAEREKAMKEQLELEKELEAITTDVTNFKEVSTKLSQTSSSVLEFNIDPTKQVEISKKENEKVMVDDNQKDVTESTTELGSGVDAESTTELGSPDASKGESNKSTSIDENAAKEEKAEHNDDNGTEKTIA